MILIDRVEHMSTRFCNQTELMSLVSGNLPGDVGTFSLCPTDAGEAKFCVVFSSLATSLSNILGLCVPMECTTSNISSYIVETERLNSTFGFYTKSVAQISEYIFCSDVGNSLSQEQSTVSTHDVVMIAVLGTWIGLVFIATAYDYVKGITLTSEPWQRVRRNSEGNVVHVVEPPPLLKRRVWIFPRPAEGRKVAKAGELHNTKGSPPRSGRKRREALQRSNGASDASSLPLLSPTAAPVLDDSEGDNDSYDERVPNHEAASRGYGTEGRSEDGGDSSPERDESQSPDVKRGDGERINIRTSATTSGAEEENLEATNFFQTVRLSQFIGEQRLEALKERKEQLKQYMSSHLDRLPDLPELPNLPDFHSIWVRIVLCMSLTNSFRKWRYYPHSEANINIFNSLRVLAWLWIVNVDTFEYTMHVPTYTTKVNEETNPMYAFVQRQGSSGFAIGTFLIISGFTTIHRIITLEERPMSAAAIVMRNTMTTTQIAVENTLWYVKYFISRFIRVLPLYCSILFLLQPLLARAGNGPFWSTFTTSPSLNANCRKYWWSNILLVNNFLPHNPSDRCFPWAYYIAIEFQLVLVAPFFHFIFKKLGYQVFAVVALLISLASLVLRYFWQPSCSQSVDPPSRYSFDMGAVYEEPHLMVVPFLAGAGLYYAYRAVVQRQENMKLLGDESSMILMKHEILSQKTDISDRASFWLLLKLRSKQFRVVSIWSGFFLMLGCIVASWQLHRLDHCNDTTLAKVFVAVAIAAWCLGVCLLILPMLFGFGGNFRLLLIHRLWCGASRLVFAAYLLHPVVISFCNANKYAPSSMEFLLFLVDSWGNVGVSLIVAFMFHLGVEQPSIHLGS